MQKENAQFEIEKCVDNFLKKYKIPKNEKVIISFSGGADSLALLIALHKFNDNISAIYVNHHLRSNNELESEILLNKNNAQKLGVEFIQLDVNIDVLNVLKKTQGEECAARELRYELIEKYAAEHKINYIFTAHNSDDCDESDIINFFRGADFDCSIKEKKGIVYRPLLSISHAENEHYVVSNGFNFSLDSTNLTSQALRVSIRKKLKPVLSEIFPSFRKAFLQRRSRYDSFSLADSKAIFESFSILGYKNSNNSRIKRKNIDCIIDEAKNIRQQEKKTFGDVVVLHRKSDIWLVNAGDETKYEKNRVAIDSSGLYKFNKGIDILVSEIKPVDIVDKLKILPSSILVISKEEFIIRNFCESDKINLNGKEKLVLDILKKTQIQKNLHNKVLVVEKNKEIVVILLDNFGLKNYISDIERDKISQSKDLYVITIC